MTGLEPLVEKTAARAGVDRIRSLLRLEGIPESAIMHNLDAAKRLTQAPHVLPDPQLERIVVNGKLSHLERGNLGSELWSLGRPGQEQTATLVADPLHQIAVRKIRHPNSVVPLDMQNYAHTLQNHAAPYTARHLGNYRHPATGAHVSYHEFVPGQNAEALLGRIRDPDEWNLINKTIATLRGEVERVAATHGMQVGDLNPKNAILRRTPNGYEGKFIDFTAAPLTYQGGAGQPINPPDYKETMRRVFQPTPAEAAEWGKTNDQELAAFAARTRRPPAIPARLGAEAASAAAPKKIDPRQEAIDAFMKQKALAQAAAESATANKPLPRRPRGPRP